MPDKQKLPEATSWPEWVVAALGGILIIATIGYMLLFSTTHHATPPDIIITQTRHSTLSHGYLVEFTARNSGNATAANLVVQGSLTTNGKVVEQSETTIDYLPHQAERKGGLIFTRDPEGHEITIRASGYFAP